MNFGNGVYGIGDAAQYYYNKTVPDLTEREFISLIACLIDPTGLNAKDHPAENALRVKLIEKLLSGEYKPQGVFDITYEGAD
jgi:membrane peptidoglycan carboxypeptidase